MKKTSKKEQENSQVLEQIILVNERIRQIQTGIEKTNIQNRLNKLLINFEKIGIKRTEFELNSIKNFISGTLNKAHYNFSSIVKYDI